MSVSSDDDVPTRRQLRDEGLVRVILEVHHNLREVSMEERNAQSTEGGRTWNTGLHANILVNRPESHGVAVS